MTTAHLACPLDLPSTTLTAWRDGARSIDESARIAAHVANCAACRQTLALYESLDEALRGQSVPTSDGRLWNAIHARMTDSRPTHINRWTMRRVAGAGSALAAVLLLALGFAQLFQARGDLTSRPSARATSVPGTPTPLPTAVAASPAVAGRPLIVKPANFPASGVTFGEQSDDILTFGVAAGDGASAYSCYSTTTSAGSQITIYRTSNRAIDWTRLFQQSVPLFQTSECEVQVDTLAAQRVLVSIRGQNFQNLQDMQWHEFSDDGGATWKKLTNNDTLYGLATADGHTYTMLQHSAGQQNNGLPLYTRHLAVSVDGLRNWQPIDGGLITASNQMVTHFWAQPGGELLAEVTTTQVSAQNLPLTTGQALWQTHDGGQHWQLFQIPLPPGSAHAAGYIVRQPLGNAPWGICQALAKQDSHPTPDAVVCTFDGGKNWTVSPALCASAPCASSPTDLGAGDLVLAADNSLLAIAPDRASHLGLYRLPADTGRWEYLGQLSGSNAMLYTPSAGSAAGGGVLWLYAGGTYLGSLSGIIGGHQSLPGTLTTASYP
jgi:hypothetical protein